MNKVFNISAACNPKMHYMVNIDDRLREIKAMIDHGDYFTINRARQYGKTTVIKALGLFLKDEYVVLSLDFQKLSHSDFETEDSFVEALAGEILKKVMPGEAIPNLVAARLREFTVDDRKPNRLSRLFGCLSEWCAESEKPVVLIIDEVDSASNNQVFLDFLSQLRGYYIDRDEVAAFQSVILAGVYDVKNIKHKIRTDETHKVNSPWNIAAEFCVKMDFSAEDIAGMLVQYEEDYRTGMDVREMSHLLYEYTSGYPFLVSGICKLIDEKITGMEFFPDKKSAWTKAGLSEAVKIFLIEKNTLFESVSGKIEEYPELHHLVYTLLFTGSSIPYSSLNRMIEMAEMFGLIKNLDGYVVISNRIFEMVLYNMFLSEEALRSDIYKAALKDKNRFIQNGHLNMELILERFVVHFNDLYGNLGETFLEEAGRRFFLLYLKPIINGIGNYYIEAQTRNLERTDVVIDYRGEQFVIELKIWRGNAYHERGEEQLLNYLDHYHLMKGYMISFNFNQKKETGIKEIILGDKVIVEAVV